MPFGGVRETLSGWDFSLRIRAAVIVASGRETFHAKVVLADANALYVGSSNFMGSALDRSFECGVIVRGEAARQLRYVLAALQSVARPIANY